MRVGRCYVIDWLDHYETNSAQAWTATASLNVEPVRIRTVGYVVKTTPQAVAVAHTLCNGESTSAFIIVRAGILQAVELKLPPKPRSNARKESPA